MHGPEVKQTSGSQTFLIGGSGIDRRYLVDLAGALSDAGISEVEILNHFRAGILPAGALAFLGMTLPVLWPDPRVTAATTAGAAINLVGYSWGALCAAAFALYLAGSGEAVEHLVLIGAPLDAKLLDACRRNQKIRHVHVVDLPDDPIRAGDPLPARLCAVLRLPAQYPAKRGHFRYVASGKAGDADRRDLAERLASLLARA